MKWHWGWLETADQHRPAATHPRSATTANDGFPRYTEPLPPKSAPSEQCPPVQVTVKCPEMLDRGLLVHRGERESENDLERERKNDDERETLAEGEREARRKK